MTAHTAGAVRTSGPARVAGDVSAVTLRNLRRVLRSPGVLVLGAVMPVVFIVMFTYVFGGAVGAALPGTSKGAYASWLVPGLIAQFALFGATNTAGALADDLKTGVLDRWRSLPMSRSAALIGRTLADLLRSAVMLMLMSTVGFAVGFRPTGVGGLLAGIGVALVLGHALSWAMALLGLLARSAEAVQAAVYMLVFPLGFTSTVFVPVGSMPGWLQGFAAHQPVTTAANALRGLMLGPDALPAGTSVGGQVALSLGWAVVLVAVVAPMAVRVYGAGRK